MQTFFLEIREPKRVLFHQAVEWTSFDLSEGKVTIYSGHAALMGEIIAGDLIYSINGQQSTLTITKGFAHITPEKTILLVE